jgi:hypothetical protein
MVMVLVRHIIGTDIDYIHGNGAGTAYYLGSDISGIEALNGDIAEFYLISIPPNIWT